MKRCSVPGCNNPVIAKGYCSSHYGKWKRHGTPTPTTDNRSNTEEDFWSKVSIGEEQDCWLWLAAKDGDGYGFFWWHNCQVRAHRFSWEIFAGIIEDGLQVLHGCDNPSCVNPSHLFLGTTQDNTRDRDSKKRQIKGEDCHSAVLSKQDVVEIRSLSLQGISGRRLAKRFGVDPTTVYKLLNGGSWKHV